MSRVKQEFLIYGFLGWILENCFHKVVEGTFIKPNFLHGPIKPMYGFGGVLLTRSYRRKPSSFLYASILIPLAVEWCSGKWLDCRYRLKYWDYSGEKIQLGGYICLRFALCWVLLAQVVVHIIQPLIDRWLNRMGSLAVWSAMFHSFVLDCVLTIYRREKEIQVI